MPICHRVWSLDNGTDKNISQSWSREQDRILGRRKIDPQTQVWIFSSCSPLPQTGLISVESHSQDRMTNPGPANPWAEPINR